MFSKAERFKEKGNALQLVIWCPIYDADAYFVANLVSDVPLPGSTHGDFESQHGVTFDRAARFREQDARSQGGISNVICWVMS